MHAVKNELWSLCVKYRLDGKMFWQTVWISKRFLNCMYHILKIFQVLGMLGNAIETIYDGKAKTTKTRKNIVDTSDSLNFFP